MKTFGFKSAKRFGLVVIFSTVGFLMLGSILLQAWLNQMASTGVSSTQALAPVVAVLKEHINVFIGIVGVFWLTALVKSKEETGQFTKILRDGPLLALSLMFAILQYSWGADIYSNASPGELGLRLFILVPFYCATLISLYEHRRPPSFVAISAGLSAGPIVLNLLFFYREQDQAAVWLQFVVWLLAFCGTYLIGAPFKNESEPPPSGRHDALIKQEPNTAAIVP